MSDISYPPFTGTVPTPYTSTPLGVTDGGSAGIQSTQFAMGDHTHASRARKTRVIGVTTATYTWTYPTPFTVGSIPVVTAMVEDPSNSTTDSYNVQVVGVPTNTQCTFRIIRTSSGLLALLTGALSLNSTPGTVNLHCIGLEP